MFTGFLCMRLRGLEPPHPFGHMDLNHARLPFRHSRRKRRETNSNISMRGCQAEQLPLRSIILTSRSFVIFV